MVLMTFEEIMDIFNIPHTDFLKYLQLRYFIRTQQNQILSIPSTSTIENLMTMNCLEWGIISQIYKHLEDRCTETSEGMKGRPTGHMSMEECERACIKAQSRTFNAHLKLLQFNWLMQTYITPENAIDIMEPYWIYASNVRRKRVHCSIVFCAEIQQF